MKKNKPYWEMNTVELAEATKEFDDPNFDPPAVKPTAADRAHLRKWQRTRIADRLRLVLYLDKQTLQEAGTYAADHGLSVTEVFTTALHKMLRKKSA